MNPSSCPMTAGVAFQLSPSEIRWDHKIQTANSAPLKETQSFVLKTLLSQMLSDGFAVGTSDELNLVLIVPCLDGQSVRSFDLRLEKFVEVCHLTFCGYATLSNLSSNGTMQEVLLT